MTIAVGTHLPDATLLRMGANGPEPVALSALVTGRKVVIFGFPGAVTGTCTTAPVPRFIRTKAGVDAKAIDARRCSACGHLELYATRAPEPGESLVR